MQLRPIAFLFVKVLGAEIVRDDCEGGSKKSKKKSMTKAISIVIIAAFLAVMVFPFFWILITSFKPSSEISAKNRHSILLPTTPTLTNYARFSTRVSSTPVEKQFYRATITTSTWSPKSTPQARIFSRASV